MAKPKSKSKSTGTGKYEKLLATCSKLAPVSTVVAHPCEESALKATIEAAEAGLIQPILVGPVDRVKTLARPTSRSISIPMRLWMLPIAMPPQRRRWNWCAAEGRKS